MTTFTYDAGSSSPTFGGLAEFNGVRINNGSFKSHQIGLLTSGPTMRNTVQPLPGDHGSFGGVPYWDGRAFPVDGWLLVDTADAIQLALDYLASAYNLKAGLRTFTYQARGWSAARIVTARVNGAIVVNDPGFGRRKTRRRDYSIPMFAPDPMTYSAALHTADISPGATALIPNAGNEDTHFTVRFTGPLVNPRVGFDLGGAALVKVRYAGTLASSSDWVEVQSNPAAVGGVTAVDNTGASVMAAISARSFRVLQPGNQTVECAADSGGGHATISWRDAWSL